MKFNLQGDAVMAAALTRAASRQTDLTIGCLVDRGRVADAYRAYGYFRWVDDWLDQEMRQQPERQAFIERQKELLEACYLGKPGLSLAPEEHMLVSLIARDHEPNSGLQTYIRNMMSVMEFDSARRGRLISTHELEKYTGWLAKAVTEAMHYFIGHGGAAPRNAARYQAVGGAHITHMLRDAVEDANVGYYNIPAEFVRTRHIKAWEVNTLAYREWVEERVQQARRCFKSGRGYMGQVASLRCRLAGYAYIHRFEMVLNSIERDGYLLRRHYPELKEGGKTLQMIGLAMWQAMKPRKLPAFSPAFRL